MTAPCQLLGAFGQDVPGLDVLHLPKPGEPSPVLDCHKHRLPGWGLPHTSDPVVIARFRWWIGHQMTFCVWRLLSDCLTKLAGQPRPPSDLVQLGALLYDIYSLLLVYAGSCSPADYATVIRPEMVAADGAFSGRWARDYEHIPQQLRALRKTAPSSAFAPIIKASKANLVVHMAVARRLARGGDSLLRMSGQADSVVTDDQRDLYDSFFHVRRTQICRREFVMQLFDLCMAVLDDLAEHPLEACIGWFTAPSAERRVIERCVANGPKSLWDLLMSSYPGRVLA